MKSTRDELFNYRVSTGVIKKAACSKAEAKEFSRLQEADRELPDGVFTEEYNTFSNTVSFFRIQDDNLGADEVREYLMYRQL